MQWTLDNPETNVFNGLIDADTVAHSILSALQVPAQDIRDVAVLGCSSVHELAGQEFIWFITQGLRLEIAYCKNDTISDLVDDQFELWEFDHASTSLKSLVPRDPLQNRLF